VRSIPNAGPEYTGAVVKIYDLRDPEAWERAGRERAAWGRQWTEIYILDHDHVAIEFKRNSGGASSAVEAAS
jgi:hypothetical protein